MLSTRSHTPESIIQARDPKQRGRVNGECTMMLMMMVMLIMMTMMMMMCEPAQLKYTWTFHKSHFDKKITGKMPDAPPAASVLCEHVRAYAVEMHTDNFTRAILRGNLQEKCRKSHFVQKFTGKMPDPYPATPILCEPAQSKCTWTCHNSHFVGKKPPDASDTTSIEHQAVIVTVRTPQCGHTVSRMRVLPKSDVSNQNDSRRVPYWSGVACQSGVVQQ